MLDYGSEGSWCLRFLYWPFTEARLTSTSRNRSQRVHPYYHATEWTETIVHFRAPLCQED